MAVEDKARDRVESGDSWRERNAVPTRTRRVRDQPGPAAARIDYFNGLLGPCRMSEIQQRVEIPENAIELPAAEGIQVRAGYPSSGR